jgi:hypothetical protein
VAIPPNRVRFQQLMETMIASMNTRLPQPIPFVIPMWAAFAISIPVVFVILWFLITQKHAFTSAAEKSARHRS